MNNIEIEFNAGRLINRIIKNQIILLIISSLFLLGNSYGQNTEDHSGRITFYINESVTNEEESYSKEIIRLWKEYLRSGQYVSRESLYWVYDEMTYPDYSYIQLLLDLRSIFQNGGNIQCNIIGLIPVRNNHYLLKCMFTQVSESTNEVKLKYITTVYVKLIDENFQFVNSTQYHKGIWEKKEVGEITYYIHPEYEFDEMEALKMNEFNKMIAKEFETEPLKFDYIATSTTTQLSELLGFDFNSYSYRPIQSGGLTDNYNKIIYAGNNSAYYPHEVVHLYTNIRFSRQYHSWVDEGIAAYFGGSTGYYLSWHLQKLKSFLEKNPDYELTNLSDLEKNIPNGEYMTDFRYAIGGLVIRKIYEKEGMKGLFEALQAGRMEEDYFQMIEEKLNIPKEEFENYIKKEIKNLKEIGEEEMKKLKY